MGEDESVLRRDILIWYGANMSCLKFGYSRGASWRISYLTKHIFGGTNILGEDNQNYSLGCDIAESLPHQVFECDTSRIVWSGVCRWLGVYNAQSNNAISHALQFSGLHVHFLKIKDNFKAIWLVTIWLIWKEINDWVFNQVDSVVDNIKI
jgi:hypothetical protein